MELPTGEVYLLHLCARPFVPELRCTLGRETAIQKMRWTEDYWLILDDGTNLPKEEVEAPVNASSREELADMDWAGGAKRLIRDDFDKETLDLDYQSLRR